MAETGIAGGNRSMMVLAVVVCGFLIAQVLMVWDGGRNQIFNSPDENANYHFARRLYDGESLRIPLPALPAPVIPFVTPRSARVHEGALVPASFLGLILVYGTVSSLLFVDSIPYLTPFFAAAAIVYFFLLVRYFFSERAGLIAAVLLAVHPAWWYYTNASLMPNVLFMSFVFPAIWYGVLLYRENRLRHGLLAGAFVGLALSVRTSELLWVAPVVGMALFAGRRYLRPRSVAALGGVILAVFAILWGVSRFVYAQALPLGYDLPIVAQNARSVIGSLLLPFGFHPRYIARTFWYYGIALFWPFTLALAFALIVRAREYLRHRAQRRYLIAWLTVSVLLFLYYGSWFISDHPDPGAVTISQSYVRYLIPFYLFAIPFIADAISRSYPVSRASVSVAVLALLAFFSLRLSMNDPDDGILAKRRVLERYDAAADWVDESIPRDGIVVTPRADKYIWPRRLVITAVDHPDLPPVLAALAGAGYPLYYIDTPLSDERLRAMNEALLPAGVVVRDAFYTNSDISVYPIEQR